MPATALGKLDVELSANTAKFVENLQSAARSVRGTSDEMSRGMASIRSAAASLNASLATEHLSTEKIVASRRNIISLAEKEVAMARAKGLEDGRNVSILRQATAEIEKQKNALAGVGPFSNATAEILNAVKLRATAIPGLGGLGQGLALRAYEPIGRMMEQGAGALEGAFGSAAVVVGGFAAGLAAVAAGGVAVTDHMMNLAQSIENTSAATGLATKQVQELNEVAKLMDVDAGSLEMAFSRIDAQIGEYVTTGKAASDGSQLFTRVMKQMGVSLTTATGEARPANDVLGDFYDALQRIPDSATRTALTMEALGTRGRVIAQIFDEARREGLSYRDMLEKVDASGNVLGDDQIAMLLEAKAAWDATKEAVSGFVTQLEVAISTAALHPLITAKSLIDYGSSGMGMAEMEAAPEAAQKAQAANEGLLISKIAQANELLDKRVAILRAGGEMQLQLSQAEDAYAMAVAAHAIAMERSNAALAGQKQAEIVLYAQQISSLKEIVALEAKHEDLSKLQNAAAAAEVGYIVAALNGDKALAEQKAKELAQLDKQIAALEKIKGLVESTALASLRVTFQTLAPRAAPGYASTLYPPGFEGAKSGLAPAGYYTAAESMRALAAPPAIPAGQPSFITAPPDISALTGPSSTEVFGKAAATMTKLNDQWLESTGHAVELLQEKYRQDLENYRLMFEQKQITAEQFATAQAELQEMASKKISDAYRQEVEQFGTVTERMKLLLQEVADSGKDFNAKIFAELSSTVDNISGALAELIVTGRNGFRELFQSLAVDTLKNSFQYTFSAIAKALEPKPGAARPMNEQIPGSPGATPALAPGLIEKIGGIFGIKSHAQASPKGTAADPLYVVLAANNLLSGTGPGANPITGGAASIIGSLFGARSSESAGANPITGGAASIIGNLFNGPSAAGGATGLGFFSKLTSMFGAGGFSSILSKLPMFAGFMAAGGDVTPGKAYIVGENHPEIFVPRASGRIIPKLQMGGDRHQTTVNLHVHGVTDADSFQRSGTQIYATLHSQLAAAHARNG